MHLTLMAVDKRWNRLYRHRKCVFGAIESCYREVARNPQILLTERDEEAGSRRQNHGESNQKTDDTRQ